MLDTHWTVDIKNPVEGKCCPTSTTYMFDPLTRNGDCCMPNQNFWGTACKFIDQPVKSEESLGTANNCPTCGNGNVCSYNDQLGIRYGHCYTMKDSSNRELMRDESYYYKNADTSVEGHPGLSFRICLSSTNCTQNLDQYVPEGGSWFQRDDRGGNAYTGPSFVSNGGNFYYLVLGNPTYPTATPPVNFTGKGTCIFGECSICVQFGNGNPSGFHGMARVPGYFIAAVSNPSTCVQFHYEETACSPAVNAIMS